MLDRYGLACRDLAQYWSAHEQGSEPFGVISADHVFGRPSPGRSNRGKRDRAPTRCTGRLHRVRSA